MALVVSILVFLLIAGAVTLFGYRRYVRAGAVYEKLQVAAPAGLAEEPPDGSLFYSVTQLVAQVGRALPPSPRQAPAIRRELISAGHRARNSMALYQGLRVILLASALLGAVAWDPGARFGLAARMLVCVLLAVSAWRLPHFCLARQIRSRRLRLRKALPDALDLMVVCAEAGAALDRSFRSVTQHLSIAHPDLSDEFGLVTAEMSAGVRRSEALANLGDRTGEAELRKFITVLTQADRFGTSMGDAMRTHAAYLRVRRRLDAEERAGKVGVKLIFPIFFFIMPCMFLVTVGPAAMQIGKNLLPLLARGL